MALFKSKQLSGSVALAATASYINPLFISASAAAYGFGSGGNTGSVVVFPYTGSADILGSLSVNGPVIFSSISNDVFIVKNANKNLLTISQSGVVLFTTQSMELVNYMPAGAIYFTSNSFFVSLE